MIFEHLHLADWAGVDRRFLTPGVVHFSCCHMIIQECCRSQNGKVREVLFRGNFIERDFFYNSFLK